jgi:RNA polymerase sigma-70 factor (ECF subfamily)
MEEIFDYKDLMLRARDGDGLAFQRIYEDMYAPVYRYLYGRTKNKDLADDFVQTVFLKFFESLHRLKPNDTPLRFLFTVARNTLIDYWRKKKEILLAEDEKEVFAVIPDKRPNQEAEYAQNELSKNVQDYLSCLNEDDREVIVLKYYSGLPAKDIAVIMKISEEAVRQRQFRVLKKLKVIIEEYGN